MKQAIWKGRYTTKTMNQQLWNDRARTNKFWHEESETQHPTQKPIALFEYLVKTYTNEGETVLDNCIGSGTTAIACKNTNRNFIGMEQEQKYFDIATKRIDEWKPNLLLFWKNKGERGKKV